METKTYPTVPSKHHRFLTTSGEDYFLVSCKRENICAQWHWNEKWQLLPELDSTQREDASNAAELYWREEARQIAEQISRHERGLPGEWDAHDLAAKYANEWEAYGKTFARISE